MGFGLEVGIFELKPAVDRPVLGLDSEVPSPIRAIRRLVYSLKLLSHLVLKCLLQVVDA